MAMHRVATGFLKFVLTPFLVLPCAAHAVQKCIAEDGSVSYVDVCPAGTQRAPSRTDPQPPPAHKGTAPVKPDPFQGFKPVPDPKAQAEEQASAPPKTIGPQVAYYDIEGADVAALLRALEARGAHAESSWKLSYEFKPDMQAGGCRVASVSTALEQRVVLPRWKAPAGADPGLVERWKRYVEALRAHEERRLDAARELEADLGPALMALGPAASCGALNDAALARYETLVARARAREADFVARGKSGLIELPLLR